MTLCVVFAVVALATARADVSELPGYKYTGPAVHHRHNVASSSQYASRFGPGSLEVIPLNLAHVSTTVHKAGDVGFGKDSAGYSSGYSSSSQYSSGSGGYPSGGVNYGGQYYSSGANLGAQYYAPVSNLGVQYSSGANLAGQYSSGAQYSGAQYHSGPQYFSGAQQYSSAPVLSSSSGFAQSGFSSGLSSDGSFAYNQLINDVLSGKYTVGSYSPSAYTASSHRQKLNINLQPNAAPVTYRHVYFAEAPAEAPIQPRIHVEGAIQPRKHVKVVFIKTPDQGGIADQELTLPQLEEEKTQIYVLSKEHNYQPQINIKAANAGTASRPEIFFLKYRNEEDALKAQQVLRANAGKEGFAPGALLADTNLSSGISSGFTEGQSSGASSSAFNRGLVSGLSSGASSSAFNGGLVSGLSSGISSGASSGQSAQSGSSNAGYASGLSPGASSGFTTNSASSIQSSGASGESLPLKEHGYSSNGSSNGVTALYGTPSVGDSNSGGYIR